MHKLSLELPNAEHVQYDLYGVVSHGGERCGGNYAACVKSEAGNGIWVKCDDCSLKCCADKDVVANDAYMLLYRRTTLSSSNLIHLNFK